MKSKKRVQEGQLKLADASKITITKDEHGNNIKRIPRGNHCYHSAMESLRHGKNWRKFKNNFVPEKNIKL